MFGQKTIQIITLFLANLGNNVMFYILSETYVPNTAVTNHALSFVRGFSDLGINAKWVFLMNGGKNQRVDIELPGVEVQYLWTPFWSKNKYIKHLYKHYAYAKFFFSLKPGDTVLLLLFTQP